MTHSTRRLALRRPLRLAVPVIALAALALAGEPLQEPANTTLANLCEPASTQLAGSDAAASGDTSTDIRQTEEHRARAATRIRWSLTLPALSRPLGRISGA
ncbi:MAG: hypothetical protein WDA70_10390 [Lysobacteraceae bacterium]